MQTDIGAATAMHEKNVHLIRWLTYLMFMMFAMTSDSVGEIIKEVKREFDVSNTQASLMHSLFMIGIAKIGRASCRERV